MTAVWAAFPCQPFLEERKESQDKRGEDKPDERVDDKRNKVNGPHVSAPGLPRLFVCWVKEEELAGDTEENDKQKSKYRPANCYYDEINPSFC